jgi:uncharacterized protein (TIGR00725 family)
MILSVIGGEGAPPEANRMAEEVGRELAKRGVTVCCGGGGGIMEAANRGARSAGGHTIGILPGRDASESPPNAWVEFPVFTGIGYARNAAVVLTGDAVIAVDGAYGTPSEIAYAMIHDAWSGSTPGTSSTTAMTPRGSRASPLRRRRWRGRSKWHSAAGTAPPSEQRHPLRPRPRGAGLPRQPDG